MLHWDRSETQIETAARSVKGNRYKESSHSNDTLQRVDSEQARLFEVEPDKEERRPTERSEGRRSCLPGGLGVRLHLKRTQVAHQEKRRRLAIRRTVREGC